MISTRLGLLFCHIRKTGGNAIQSVLGPYADEDILRHGDDRLGQFAIASARYPGLHKHSFLQEYHDQLGLEKFNQLVKVACIRNPWDRLMSWWFHFEYGTRNNPKTTGRWIFRRSVEPVFVREKFIKFVSWNRRAPDGDRCSMRAAMEVNGVIAADVVLRYENLGADFATLCRQVNLEEKNVPVLNDGRTKDYRQYYGKDLIEWVADVCRSDITTFDYRYQ